jgi:hypothetical protein
MSANRHGKHRKDPEAQAENDYARSSYWQVHKDWRMWVVVVLMLVGIFTYVMTMDEAVRPGAPVGQPVPAATGP